MQTPKNQNRSLYYAGVNSCFILTFGGNTLSYLITNSEIILRTGIALFGGFLIPLNCFNVILCNAMTPIVTSCEMLAICSNHERDNK